METQTLINFEIVDLSELSKIEAAKKTGGCGVFAGHCNTDVTGGCAICLGYCNLK